MGGARPKTTVEADQALWLAKFPAPSDTWNQPRVEHGLLLQRCCSKFGGNSGLLKKPDRLRRSLFE